MADPVTWIYVLAAATAVSAYSSYETGKGQQRAMNKNADLARVEGMHAQEMAERNNELLALDITRAEEINELNQKIISADIEFEKQQEARRQTLIETDKERVDRASTESREEVGREASRIRARQRAVFASRGINISMGTPMSLLAEVGEDEQRLMGRIAFNESSALTDLVTEADISATQSERFLGKLTGEKAVIGRQTTETVRRLRKEQQIQTFRGATVVAQRAIQQDIYTSRAREARKAGFTTAVSTVLGGSAKTYKFGYDTELW